MMSPKSRIRGVAITALVIAYSLVPNGRYVLPGIPLRVAATAVIVAAVAGAWLLKRDPGMPRGMTAALAACVAVKILAAALPAAGWNGAYSAGAAVPSPALRSTDRAIDSDATTFPREFPTDFRLRWRTPASGPAALPFAVTWRGWIPIERPPRPSLVARASAPTSVAVDGAAVPSILRDGLHEIRVEFRRETDAAPYVHVQILAADPGRPLPVFSRPVSSWQRRAARAYPAIALVMDALVAAVAVSLLVAGVRTVTRREAPMKATFRLAVVAAVGAWLVVGAIRTAGHFDTTEFLVWGDDWTSYEAAARAVLSGDWRGMPGRAGYGTILYPYALAGLHALFGPRYWPVYFAQYVMLGLACATLAVFARRTWGDATGVSVLAGAVVVSALDIARWYPVRFISENLVLCLVPLAFLALERFRHRASPAAGIAAGVLLAAYALTRFNLVPFAVVAVGWAAVMVDARPVVRFAPAIALAVAYGMMPLREFLVAHSAATLPQDTKAAYFGFIAKHWQRSPPDLVRAVIVPNAAFLLGYPKLWIPEC